MGPRWRVAGSRRGAWLGRLAARGLWWVSLLASCTYVLVAARHPTAALDHYTDHLSHYSTAILFFHAGLDVYRRSPQELCAATSAADAAYGARADVGFPLEELCTLPGREGRRPPIITWHGHIRPYPPGIFLYSLPEALLYARTGLPFQLINQLSLLKYLVAGHLLLWALWRSLRAAAAQVGTWPLWLVLPLLWPEVLRWSMSGFYDPLAVLCVVLAVEGWARGRHPLALFWLGAGLSLHFRALWYAPLGAFLLWELARGGRLRSLSRRDLLLLGAGALLAGCGAFTFWLALPRLGEFPRTNPVHLSLFSWLSPAHLSLGFALGCLAGYLAWHRQWLLLSVVAWQTFVLVRTPQTQPWHALFLIPLLVLPRVARDARGAAMGACAFVLLVAVIVFRVWPDGGELVVELLQRRI